MKLEKTTVFRGVLYLVSMVVLAFGIVLNSKSGLGVSPLISVAFAASQMLGTSFGDATMVEYFVFVGIEIVIHLILRRKKFTFVMDALQIPISIIVSRFINLFDDFIPNFAVDMAGTFWGSMAGRIVVLLVAIVFTGIGAATSLNMRVIPNPGDGMVQAVADIMRKPVGFAKNCADISCVIFTVVLSLIVTRSILGVGVGTLIAMIGTGRVMAVLNLLFKDKMLKAAGIEA